MAHYRVGRSSSLKGRSVYRVVGDEASRSDVFLGLMDRPEWADLVVRLLNGYAAHPLLDDAPLPGDEGA